MIKPYIIDFKKLGASDIGYISVNEGINYVYVFLVLNRNKIKQIFFVLYL